MDNNKIYCAECLKFGREVILPRKKHPEILVFYDYNHELENIGTANSEYCKNYQELK